MHEIDDPLLALILRFVVQQANSHLPDEACMRLQVALIEKHIAGFPVAERELRAIEWVERCAWEFREECRGKLVAKALGDGSQCSDCPLIGSAGGGPCSVHERWAAPLYEYLGDGLSPAGYVKESLGLLQENKNRLRVSGLC